MALAFHVRLLEKLQVGKADTYIRMLLDIFASWFAVLKRRRESSFSFGQFLSELQLLIFSILKYSCRVSDHLLGGPHAFRQA